MAFDEREMKRIKSVIEVMRKADPQTRRDWEMRAAIAVAVIRQNFPHQDDEVLAAIALALSFVVAEISDMPMRDVSEGIGAIYMAYSLAVGRILKLYDPSCPDVKLVEGEEPPQVAPTASPHVPGHRYDGDPHTGQYL